MARAAVQGNHLNTFGRLFAVARAVGPAWTFINLEGFCSLEDVAPTLLEVDLETKVSPFSYYQCLAPDTSVLVRNYLGLKINLPVELIMSHEF